MVYQLLLHGNSFCAIQRGVGNKIIGLIPLMSSQMLVTLLADGTITYTYTDNGSVVVYAAESIWHNKLFGNGIIGLSTLSYGRNCIGIGLAAEQVVTKIYQNGGKPSGVLTIDRLLTPEQRAQIKENFREMTEGDNSRLFTLEAGFTYQQVSLSPQDIELLSSRKFQIEDVARFFGVPSVLINDTGANTTWGSGIQQIVEGFFKFSIRPCLNRMQESMKCWLLPPEERLLIEICFDACDLLMPAISDRITMYKNAIQGGLMPSNEARRAEGWNPLPGGDDLLVQRQMVALKDLENVKNTAPSYVTPAS
jgi:HK97 family phage portal protein